MKIRNCIPGLLLVSILLPTLSPAVQGESTRETIFRAMKDEMNRNMNGLHLEKMERPFFISYTIHDKSTVEILASLGAIISSEESHNRNSIGRVMVGDYALNDENFRDYNFNYSSSMVGSSGQIPLEDDYEGIRRALWVSTDNVYKNAAELFEHKKAAIKQQTMSGEQAGLDDFSKAPAVVLKEPPRTFSINRWKWENIAKELSAVFRDYPDICSSRVRFFFYQGEMYLANSEGTEVAQPLTLASLQIDAYTQAVDGEPLSNHDAFFGFEPDELPSVRVMKRAVKDVADKLNMLRSAPVFNESYFGPVMFEEQAVAEFFSQRLFGGNNGLLAFRQPVVNNAGAGYRPSDETLDDRIGRRILSRDITVKALPVLKRYMDVNLLGSYQVDAEGVKPPAEITLVENGILNTLLNNRIPTPKVRASNAHERPVLSAYRTSQTLGPSVISIESSEGKTKEALKRELLKRASEEGMDYGILVRRLLPMFAGSGPLSWMGLSSGKRGSSSLTRPLLIYRVYVADGREEPVRSAQLGDVSLSTLRHIASVAERRFVYNTLATANWRTGIPASFIVPESLILEEIEVKNEKRGYTPKLPVVPAPLAAK